eukprot:s4728_g2.t1
MLADAHVDDPNLFQDICDGFRLVGDIQPSGQFQRQLKPASLHVEQLRQTAMWAQKAVVSSCRKCSDDLEVARAVWSETVEQSLEDKQWVKGPFTADEITKRNGNHWIPSRRFGVRQGGKIRAVDDFSQYLINSTVTCHEKIDLEGIDHICSTARFFMGASSNSGMWQIPSSESEGLCGQLHTGWPLAETKNLFGRCLDLRQAYKQLVRHPADSWASILAVYCPEDNQVYFFEAIALPFGSVSSAAFDSDVECHTLCTGLFPDMIDEEVRDVTAELLRWQVVSAPAFKRLRLGTVDANFVKLPPRNSADIQTSFLSISQSSVVTVLELATKKRQKKLKDEAPDARAKRFDSERRKYTVLLANIIKRAGLPVVQLVSTLDDPETAWTHLFAARRANTLKNRFKSWRPFENWLELHRGRCFPTSCKDIIDYMQFRVDEGCGKTVPESFSIALNLIEVLGRVPEDQQLSRDPLWLGHIKSWGAELSADSPPRRPAEMYTVAMIISLELTVEDETESLFKRALSWVVLVMVWAALRCDDVQSVLPHRSILTNFGLKLLLGKTKTTGPDKPQKEIVAHVFRTVSLTGTDWLGIGYRIWDTEQFSFRRDYLVMEPKRDWSGVRRKFLPPADLSSLIRKLLSSLRVPQRRSAYWELMGTSLLLPDGLEMHFSGHSPRNFVTSVAALIGFSKDMRAYLGRWSIGMTSSEEYVRTARQVVYKIQRAVNRAIVEGFEEEYYEDEAMDSLCKAAEDGGANPNRIRKRHTVMGSFTGRHCLGAKYPTLEVRPDDWVDVADDDGVDDLPPVLEDKARAFAADAAKRDAAEDSHKYFVTVSRRAAHRRLHMMGCFVKPTNCCEVRLFNTVTSEDFDAICRACKKRMLQETGKDSPEESSSTASSSSTNGGTSGEEVPED